MGPVRISIYSTRSWKKSLHMHWREYYGVWDGFWWEAWV